MNVKHLILTALALFVTMVSQAQSGDETFTLRIWDNATAPHSNGLDGSGVAMDAHRVRLNTVAELFVYVPEAAERSDMAVVVCPGGGYGYLSLENEGSKVAEWLVSNGITAAVLKYRMPDGHPEVPLEDAEQAIRIMRGDFDGMDEGVARKMAGLTCRTVGVAGFSAGGHLAAYVSAMGAVRPDFTVLFYPVITGEEGLCHAGSFDNLLGRARTAELTAAYSLENRVDAQTPPAIIFASDDDRGVPTVSSTRYYDALKRHGKAASLHIYPAGGHGWGMRETFAWSSEWRASLLDWLGRLPR